MGGSTGVGGCSMVQLMRTLKRICVDKQCFFVVDVAAGETGVIAWRGKDADCIPFNIEEYHPHYLLLCQFLTEPSLLHIVSPAAEC